MATTDVLPAVLNVDEVAQLLRVSTKTVWRMAADKKIPCRRIGRAYRFQRDQLLQWVTGAEVRGARS